MNYVPQILDSLPPPYTQEDDSVLARMVNLAALELEVLQEDLDRMRQTHWIATAYRLGDAAKLGALMGIAPFTWERLDLYRQRLVALVVARLNGALGPNEIRGFAYKYLRDCENALGSTFLPGLQKATPGPLFRPIELKENPHRQRRSQALADRGGRVPYLFRWSESNKGLDDTVAQFEITGLIEKRTVVPVLVNLSTGDLIGYSDRIPFGGTLSVTQAKPEAALDDRALQATLDGVDVTDRMFSVGNFKLGTPFSKAQLEPKAQLPRMVRGTNEWIFLSIGLYDVRGLDRFFFSIAGKDLYEAAFDQTAFDASLFPSGPIAHLQCQWTETEPACFELHVPRYIVMEPHGAEGDDRAFVEVAHALTASLAELRAAGVKAEVVFQPFQETQRQQVTARVPWKILDPEAGPSGTTRALDVGARFGESPLDGTRFE